MSEGHLVSYFVAVKDLSERPSAVSVMGGH